MWPFNFLKKKVLEQAKPTTQPQIKSDAACAEPAQDLERPRKKPTQVKDEELRAMVVGHSRGEKVLTDDERLIVCEMLAQFYKPAEIQTMIKKNFGKEVEYQAVTNYENSPRWQPIINRLRQEYLQAIDHIPIRHKKVRLQRLENIYQSAEDEDVDGIRNRRSKRNELVGILESARDEMQESKHGDTTNILVNLSDEELFKRQLALQEKIVKLNTKVEAANAQGK